MKTKNLFSHSSVYGMLGIALVGLIAVAGCVVEPDGRAYVAPVVVEPAPVVVESDLVYYPDYEIYFDPVAHVYWHSERGVWISGPAPIGVSVDVLLGSASVHTGFRGSPELHHADVIRRYPHGWRPEGRR